MRGNDDAVTFEFRQSTLDATQCRSMLFDELSTECFESEDQIRLTPINSGLESLNF